ncbi:MAG: hypothetical protein IPP14_15075 [Planctomycetes bacterium]|nr:hypothetical protein [Planctomycetota bacterium]
MKARQPEPETPSIRELAWMMPAGPDRELLFQYAAQFQHELGKQRMVLHLERLDATSRAMVAGLEARKNDVTVKVAVGTREGLRAVALSEKIMQRLDEIETEGFKLARARIYAETGRRVCHLDQPKAQAATPAAAPAATSAPAPATVEPLHPDLEAALKFTPDPNATAQELQDMITELVFESDEDLDAASDLEVSIRSAKLMAVRKAQKARGIDFVRETADFFNLAGVGSVT